MILDSSLEFADKQTLTAEALSTNVIKLNLDGSPNDITNQGAGEPVWVVISSLNPQATGSLSADLITSDVPTMAGATVLQTIGPVDIVGAGIIAAFRLPSAKYLQYIALNFKPDTPANMDIYAGITKDIDANMAYATGFHIQ